MRDMQSPLMAVHHHALITALVVVVGFAVLWPASGVEKHLSQGDHGVNLYAFDQARHGALPYRDYFWMYGPLMPFYYALSFKVLGVTIHSVLIGQLMINLATGLLIYFTLSRLFARYMALAASIWFWVFQPDFIHTYNHSGGILCGMLAAYAAACYAIHRRTGFLALGLGAVLALCLVKVNFGFATLAAFVCSVAIVDAFDRSGQSARRRHPYLFYLISLVALPISVLSIYVFLVWDLPFYAIRQCFPFLPGDFPYHVSLFLGLKSWLLWLVHIAGVDWFTLCFSAVVLLSAAQTIHALVGKQLQPERRKVLSKVLVIACVFYMAFLHEYLASSLGYALLWSTPFGLLLVFFLISCAEAALRPMSSLLLVGVLLLSTWVGFTQQAQALSKLKTPSRFMANERVQVYVGNGDEWFHTVQKATEFLSRQLAPNETFFALPHDALYYYLLDRRSPTRQLEFFEFFHIPEAQERDVISDLERNKVRWVLLSNHTKGIRSEKGIFGQSFCRLLAPYLAEHFEEVATFGPWEREAGWISSHAVKILHRRSDIQD